MRANASALLRRAPKRQHRTDDSMNRSRDGARRLSAVGRSVLAIGWTLLWFVPVVASLALGPALATVALIALTVLFLWRNVVRPARSRPRLAAMLRLRPWRHYGWLSVAAITQLVLTLATFVMHIQLAKWRLVPPIPDAPDFIPPEYYTHPLGPAAIFLAVALIAPMVEEFGFRGKMQYRLEVAFGVVPAIVVTAVVFSFLHGLLIGLHHLPFSLLVGWLAWRTGSIWPGVYMHVVNNAFAVAGLYLARGRDLDDGTLSGNGPYALIVAPVMLAVLLISARRIDRLVRRERRSLRPHLARSRPENALPAALL